ncbi:MAG: cyclopropane-fatty-acyl-phospholipid synthase family protein [Myxococcota bacterium]|nr:cyclopropane-fatty-acyl-phospholipid synthase family protein [Myxococcota bacterium]
MQANLDEYRLFVTNGPRRGWITEKLIGVIYARLTKIRGGSLAVTWKNRRRIFGDGPMNAAIEVKIHDESFFWALATRGTVGAAEAYMDGAWETEDLVGVLQLILDNYTMMTSLEGGLARASQPLFRAYHRVRKNTLNGSRSNISAHYDLSNDFFEKMLDETMMYSSGIFETPDATMHEASIAKLDAICRKLELQPDEQVLEIGTGWGGFAIYAAKNYGVHVTTTTISKKQYSYAKRRVAEEGLEDRITLLLKDYRELEGTFDKLVSIEMIEAVGHQYYDTFFEVCQERLKPTGAALIQAITIVDHMYEKARDSVDFIKRYIFPGSCIPSVTILCDSARKSSDLKLFHLQDIGEDYAKTLLAWREKFWNNIAEIRELGFDESFIRMWDYYLCYCIAGFQYRHISDVHMLMTRPLSRLKSPA